jgi:hypothetical protein
LTQYRWNTWKHKIKHETFTQYKWHTGKHQIKQETFMLDFVFSCIHLNCVNVSWLIRCFLVCYIYISSRFPSRYGILGHVSVGRRKVWIFQNGKAQIKQETLTQYRWYTWKHIIKHGTFTQYKLHTGKHQIKREI